jgi:hypothetical protein
MPSARRRCERAVGIGGPRVSPGGARLIVSRRRRLCRFDQREPVLNGAQFGVVLLRSPIAGVSRLADALEFVRRLIADEFRQRRRRAFDPVCSTGSPPEAVIATADASCRVEEGLAGLDVSREGGGCGAGERPAVAAGQTCLLAGRIRTGRIIASAEPLSIGDLLPSSGTGGSGAF